MEENSGKANVLKKTEKLLRRNIGKMTFKILQNRKKDLDTHPLGLQVALECICMIQRNKNYRTIISAYCNENFQEYGILR